LIHDDFSFTAYSQENKKEVLRKKDRQEERERERERQRER